MEGKLRPDFRGEVLTVLEEEEVEVEEEAGTWGSLAEDSTFRGTFSTLTARIGLGGREIKKALYCTKGGCVSYFIYCVLILTNLSTKFTYTPSKHTHTDTVYYHTNQQSHSTCSVYSVFLHKISGSGLIHLQLDTHTSSDLTQNSFFLASYWIFAVINRHHRFRPNSILCLSHS